ncbi:Os02g0223200, partial [Oryza sativa Japonica Group]
AACRFLHAPQRGVERGGVRDKPQDLVGHADAVEAAHRGEVKAAPVAAALLPCSRVVAADTLLPWSHGHRTYNLLDDGHDTVQANVELGLAVDSREYGIGAQVAKFVGLKGYRLAVVGRVPGSPRLRRASPLRPPPPLSPSWCRPPPLLLAPASFADK